MKIAIIGAGAIGGYVGVKLSLAGEDVTLIVRGANLEAIRRRGMKLVMSDGSEHIAREREGDQRLCGRGSAGRCDPRDESAPARRRWRTTCPSCSAQDTVVVTMQNGIPYWYFHQHGGALTGSIVRSVDPDGIIGRKIPADRVVGCVVYPASELVAPGVVRHIEGDRFPLGELDGSDERTRHTHRRVFRQCGLQGPGARRHSRRDLAQALGQPDVQSDQRAYALDARRHLPVPADARACRRDDDRGAGGRAQARHRRSAWRLEKRIAGAEKVGKHKTSMLQDVEAGRAPEIDALVGAVTELGRLTKTPTPNIDAVYALAQSARARTLHPTVEAARAP